jgi:hypothetical protein
VTPVPAVPGQLAVRLAAVEQRIQYLHNVLTRTSGDLATAQRQLGPVPQLIADLTGPITAAPQDRLADTPAGQVAALSAAVASGQRLHPPVGARERSDGMRRTKINTQAEP